MKTIAEQIEELQRLYNAYLDDGDDQEAYWIQLDLQELYEEQARAAGIEY